MKGKLLCLLIAVLLLTIVFSGCFEEKSSNFNYIEDVLDERFFGTWINISTNESPEFPLSWYTFYPDGSCFTPHGELRWYIRIYHLANGSLYDFYLRQDINDQYQTLYDVYDFTFSNDNRTLNLTRCTFSNNNKITTKFYNKLNDTLNVLDVVENSDLYLATFSLNESRWFGVNLTVEGYYNSTYKALVDSMIYSSPMLNIHVDNSSLLKDGVKYYCRGILRDYIETPFGDDYILDVENITAV
jgi:hypothetical protein